MIITSHLRSYIVTRDIWQVHEENTGMEDEKTYKSFLLDLNTALQHLQEWPDLREYHITRMAYDLWQRTVEWEAEISYSAPVEAAAAT